MERGDFFQNYRELQVYVNWTEDDACRLRSLRDLFLPHLPSLIDDFYEEIERHHDTRKVLTGGEAQISRLKRTLNGWISELFLGQYDAEYVTRRWAVGWRHVEIGLSQVYVSVALSRLRLGLLRILKAVWKGSESDRALAAQSLHRILDLDHAIIEHSYQTEFVRLYSSRLLGIAL